MFNVGLVEGKDNLCQGGPLEFENLGGKTVRLLFHIMKIYFANSRYVIIDSGFCVFKGLIELRKKDVFACDVTKKRRHWPYMVSCKEMEDNFGEVEVGDT